MSEARYMEVSRREISCHFLWDCFRRFANVHIQPYTSDAGNLVIMWRAEFDRLTGGTDSGAEKTAALVRQFRLSARDFEHKAYQLNTVETQHQKEIARARAET
ncbi:MAG: hypothetical protein V4671_08280, partial [Armatimonadota bacterium]